MPVTPARAATVRCAAIVVSAGDNSGAGGFSEGAVIAAQTSDATDDAIQKSIVSVYGK